MSTDDCATRAQSILVMCYVEGWLDSNFPDAARYLRGHMEEMADQMMEDECAKPDV